MISSVGMAAAALVMTGCDAPACSDTLRLAGPPIAVGSAPSKVAVGELTGDAHADLLVASSDDGTLILLAGDGSGRLERAETIPAGEHPVDVAIGDLDGDGDLDAAIANHETDYLTLLSNRGTGNFVPFASSPLHVELSPHPHAVLLADADGDGVLDLFVDDRRGEAILFLRGTGGAGFSADGRRISVGGDPYRGMVLADLDGDGGLDVVTPNPDRAAVTLTLPEGGYAPAAGVPADRPFEVALGDMNGDGLLDLVIAEEPGRVLVHVGRGDGSFDLAPWFEHRWAAGAKAVAVGDIDGDGIADAAATNWNSRSALVLIGGREGIDGHEVEAGDNPWGVTIGDLTADGRDELLLLDNTGGTLRVYTWTSSE